MDSLIAAILDIRRSLRDGSITSEDEVSEGVVRRLLRELGWNFENPGQVSSEYAIGGGRVDYAFFRKPPQPEVLIEVKRVGRIETRGEIQLFAYCAEQPGLLAVLTDGRTWSFYLPEGRSDYEKHRFARLDLVRDDESECARTLTRYLDFDAVFSGRSRQDAVQDHEVHSESIATQSAPQTTVPEQPKAAAAPASVGSHGPALFTLFGTTYSCRTNRDLVFAIFEKLAKRDPLFCGRCAERIHYIRRKREDFSPQNQGRKTFRPLPGGWEIDVFYNSKKWMQWIRIACEEAEIEFGQDLILQPRTSTRPRRRDKRDLQQKDDVTKHTANSIMVGPVHSSTETGPPPEGFSFTLFDEKEPCASGVDVLLGVLRRLGKRDPGLYERAAGRLPNPLAQDQYQVYPSNSDRCRRSARPLHHDWWIGVGGELKHKRRSLEKIREIAGLSPAQLSWQFKDKT